jgi:hypothetical protein
MTRRYTLNVIAAGCLLAATAVRAHHSYAEYDRTRTVEIEGTLSSASWENPHSHFRVEVAGADHRVAVWEVEGGALNYLRYNKAPLEAFKVGEQVKVAGWLSKELPGHMYATNMLSADGREIIMLGTVKPRWTGSIFSFETLRSLFDKLFD